MPHPESGDVNQIVEHWFAGIDQPGPFGSGYYTEEAYNSQARRGSGPTPTPFIDEQEAGPSFDGQHDSLRLAGIQICP